MNYRLPIRFPFRTDDLDLMFFVRWLIIAVALGLSVYVGRGTADKVMLVIAGIAGFVILIRWQRLGLLGLVVGTLVVPFSVGTGSQTPISITVILIPALFGLWLADMILHRRVHFKSSRVNWALLAMVLSAIVSFLAGSLPWNVFAKTAPITAQIGGLAIFVFAALAFWLIANQINDERWLALLVIAFLVIGALYMAGRLRIPVLSSLSSTMNGFAADGSMFWVWLVALATGQLLFNRHLHRAAQIFLALLIAATLAVGWFLARDWTSGYLPPMIAVGVILWLRSWRLGLLATIVGLLVFVWYGHFSIFNSLVGLKEYSIVTRDVARQILVEQVFPLSPILGLGPANYYWYTPLYPILGWYVSFNSHNNYVDILMQTGLVGMACFIWVLAEVGLLAWRLRNKFSGDFAQGYVYACMGGLVATLVSCWLADWLLPFVYNIGLRGFRASVLAWIFMGGLVTLEHVVRRSDSDKGAMTHEPGIDRADSRGG